MVYVSFHWNHTVYQQQSMLSRHSIATGLNAALKAQNKKPQGNKPLFSCLSKSYYTKHTLVKSSLPSSAVSILSRCDGSLTSGGSREIFSLTAASDEAAFSRSWMALISSSGSGGSPAGVTVPVAPPAGLLSEPPAGGDDDTGDDECNISLICCDVDFGDLGCCRWGVFWGVRSPPLLEPVLECTPDELRRPATSNWKMSSYPGRALRGGNLLDHFHFRFLWVLLIHYLCSTLVWPWEAKIFGTTFTF